MKRLLSIISFFRKQALWFWLTITAAVLTVVLFVFSAETAPWSYLRNIAGVIFVFWLPGFAFVKAVIPSKPPQNLDKSLVNIERFVLSVGLSVVLTVFVGVVVYYFSSVFDINSIVFGIFLLTVVCAVIGAYREKPRNPI